MPLLIDATREHHTNDFPVPPSAPIVTIWPFGMYPGTNQSAFFSCISSKQTSFIISSISGSAPGLKSGVVIVRASNFPLKSCGVKLYASVASPCSGSLSQSSVRSIILICFAAPYKAVAAFLANVLPGVSLSWMIYTIFPLRASVYDGCQLPPAPSGEEVATSCTPLSVSTSFSPSTK